MIVEKKVAACSFVTWFEESNSVLRVIKKSASWGLNLSRAIDIIIGLVGSPGLLFGATF